MNPQHKSFGCSAAPQSPDMGHGSSASAGRPSSAGRDAGQMTDKQRDLARHALGLPNKNNTTYRNHFCISNGCDGYADWEDLVSKGLAVKALGGSSWSGDFFYLTLNGAREVLSSKEHISREDAEKMRGFGGAEQGGACE
jgi:hypothetical protein